MKIKRILTAVFLCIATLGYSNEPVSEHFANSIMDRRPDGYADWDYVTGTVLKGFEMVWLNTGKQKYFDYIKKTVDRVVDEKGIIDEYNITEFNIDEIAEGRLLLMLYKETGEEKYKIAADSVRKQLDNHPRTSEGGFWHKKIYPWQMWLDGLYMGAPFYTEYAKMFNQPEDYDDITKQFLLIKKHLYDPKTGLYFHAWDESKEMFWADKKTGLSQCFWGRGLGWYAMALVDVLENLPTDHADRQQLIDMTEGLARTLKKYQDANTGLWWQVLDQGERFGNYLEASASSMFVYSIAKAVRMGWVDASHYATAKKGFDGLVDHMIVKDMNNNLSLARICLSAGVGGKSGKKVRDGSFEYYAFIEPIVPNDGKGTGPFLMAATEIEMAESKK
jgi:unsaturated rhamnogalacturonyl hydrolase